MANNLDNIKTDAEQYIDPLGAPGSILAENHQQIVKDILTNVGKYVGAPFKANKQLSIFPSGTMSWESNALNTTTPFQIKTSKLTLDLNDFGIVLGTLQIGDVLRFKDYKGRSVFLLFNSYSAGKDVVDGDIYFIEVQAYPNTINYTYQDAEVLDCVFEVFQQKASSPTNTSDLINDGSDGNSTYVENDEIVPLATQGLDFQNSNGVSQFLADTFVRVKGATFDSILKQFAVDPLQPFTYYVKFGAVLSDAEPFNINKPYPTLDDAINGYKSLTIVSNSNYKPFARFKVVDESPQKITIGMFRPSVNGKVPRIVVESFGNIIFENTNTGVIFTPFSVLGTYNDVPTRIWDAYSSVVTDKDIIFQGAGDIYTGEQRSYQSFKCRKMTFNGSNHRIQNIDGNGTANEIGDLKIEIAELVSAGGTHIVGNYDKLTVDIKKITNNVDSSTAMFSLGSLCVLKFEKIVASQKFYLGNGYNLYHGDIEGSYSGVLFPYVNVPFSFGTPYPCKFIFKEEAKIDLPCYINRTFNAPSDLTLVGQSVEYTNTALTYLTRAVAQSTQEDKITLNIDIGHLIIPNDLIHKSRGGTCVRLVNCQLDLGGVVNPGIASGNDNTNDPNTVGYKDTNRLLHIDGECIINTSLPDTSEVVYNAFPSVNGDAECYISGNLKIRSGVLASNVNIVKPSGTLTEY